MTAGPELARQPAPADPAAVQAFDHMAPVFDERFGLWRSVAAQRRAVRRALLRTFPPGAYVLELGGGTGEDALALAAAGRRVLLTDGSPAMCDRARAKVANARAEDAVTVRQATLETFESFAGALAAEDQRFDGAFSNFAALNCVADIGPVARGLARLLPRGARALLVVFGPCAPGDMLVELVRGRPRNLLRRLARGPVPARIGGHAFTVRYPGPRRLAARFAPWFRLRAIHGIGICVPPSGAEPWISGHARLLGMLEVLDRVLTRPLALLGDHILLNLERT
ncbi:MAG: class I SAM-dependent methyltransferase [Gemmatimonadales bacterium]